MAEETGKLHLPQLQWLIGEWQGFGKFTDRVTYIHKRFSYEVGGMFLVERTADIFPPEEPATDFELHQDMVIYYRSGDGLEATGFYFEGYVNQYQVKTNEHPTRLVMETYAVKNAPPGMRARITYERKGDFGFIGQFQLARPGKELKTIENLVMERIY